MGLWPLALVGFAGSNPTTDIAICLLWMVCVFSHRGLSDGPITSPGEYLRMWYVWVISIPERWGGRDQHGLTSNEKDNIKYNYSLKNFVIRTVRRKLLGRLDQAGEMRWVRCTAYLFDVCHDYRVLVHSMYLNITQRGSCWRMTDISWSAWDV
jgi:hypothetical protein